MSGPTSELPLASLHFAQACRQDILFTINKCSEKLDPSHHVSFFIGNLKLYQMLVNITPSCQDKFTSQSCDFILLGLQE